MPEVNYIEEKWEMVPHKELNESMIVSRGQYLATCWSLNKAINSKKIADRIIACHNAMVGIEDPQKLRDTWEAIKHLELDAYHNVAGKLEKQAAMIKEVVEFVNKSRGRFCIPEELINRLKKSIEP